MNLQGCTWSSWMWVMLVALVMMTRAQAALPDFMFGWSAKETRTQAGRPINRTLNTFRAGILSQNIFNTTEGVLLKEVLFQGDIKLRMEEAREILDSISKRRRKRKITANQDKWWTLPIPYRFDEELSFNKTEKAQILEGVRHWEEHTCIRFQEVPIDTPLRPVLLFKKHTGCWSYVGKENAFKLQEISVGEGCFSLGVVVHELGHAIGFWHEHSRPDRDDHIRVKYENVRVGEDFNFLKESWRYLDNLDVPYDIGSVMHYGSTAFSTGSKATIETLEPLEQNVLGQRQMLSFYDAKQANLAYCKDKCASSPVKGMCQYEGYPDPNECSRCKCPDGLTGTTCQLVAPSVGTSCGGVVQIQGRETYTIQTPGYPFHYQPNVQCNWIIKAAKDKVVNLMPIQDGFLSPQPSCDSFGGNVCDEEYTEIKYRVSMAKTGARFCCGEAPTSAIQSENNTMMVLFRTKHGGVGGFKFIVSSTSCGGCLEQTTTDQPACMVQETRWCPKMWTLKEWVPCPSFFRPVGWRCGYYAIKTAYRRGECLREVGQCCGDFKLSGNRCTLTLAEPHVVTTHSTITDIVEGGARAISNDVIDTGWSTWSSWSACSRSCGGCGTRTRTRACDKQKRSCSNQTEDKQTTNCQDNPCPSARVLCPKKRSYQQQCMIWSSKMCTRYQTYMAVCSTQCCTGYSLENGKCVENPS
ncbi:zinc metalloproteinase nas-36-like [Haliotis cracherodii]|uniref:zinc metalloproteinase nas-36-like n=1 Tax=Haliotis cracherodii TaxID=6455 RepID=UPI0039EB5C33